MAKKMTRLKRGRPNKKAKKATYIWKRSYYCRSAVLSEDIALAIPLVPSEGDSPNFQRLCNRALRNECKRLLGKQENL